MNGDAVLDRLGVAQVSSATRALAGRVLATFLPGEVVALFWDTEADEIELQVRHLYPDGKSEGTVIVSGA